jgi:hypothetical protein
VRLFETELAEHRVPEGAMAIEAARETLAEGIHSYCGAAAVLLCPGLERRAEEELIAALAACSRSVLALVVDREEAEQLSAILGCATKDLKWTASSSVAYAQQRLFEFGSEAERSQDDSFEVFAAAGEALECVDIARRVLRRAAAGERFDQMAVLLRSPERYSSVLAEAFDRAGIPIWFAEGTRRPHPAGRVLAKDGCRRWNRRCSPNRACTGLIRAS